MIYQYVGHLTTYEGHIFHMNTSHVRLATICLVQSKTCYHGNKGTGYYETSDLSELNRKLRCGIWIHRSC